MIKNECQVRCSECGARATCKRYDTGMKQSKGYLNQQERKNLEILGQLNVTLPDVIRDMQRRMNDPENQEILESLEEARDHIEYAIDCMVRFIPNDKLGEYLKNLDRFKFVMVEK